MCVYRSWLITDHFRGKQDTKEKDGTYRIGLDRRTENKAKNITISVDFVEESHKLCYQGLISFTMFLSSAVIPCFLVTDVFLLGHRAWRTGVTRSWGTWRPPWRPGIAWASRISFSWTTTRVRVPSWTTWGNAPMRISFTWVFLCGVMSDDPALSPTLIKLPALDLQPYEVLMLRCLVPNPAPRAAETAASVLFICGVSNLKVTAVREVMTSD